MIKICQNCNQSFETRTGKTKWCDDCKIVETTCCTCGQVVKIRRSRYENRIKVTNKFFCSKTCAQRNWTKLAAKHRENFVIVTCPTCGKTHRRKKHWENRVFCNAACYGKYRSAHPELYPSIFSNPSVHKRAMETRKKNGTNIMAKRGPENIHWKGGKIQYRGPSWEEQRKKAIIRDGMLCVICGNVGEQVHHIVEFRKFNYIPGQNDNDIIANHLDNLVYLCISCHGKVRNNNNGIPKSIIKRANTYFKSIKHLLTPQAISHCILQTESSQV